MSVGLALLFVLLLLVMAGLLGVLLRQRKTRVRQLDVQGVVHATDLELAGSEFLLGPRGTIVQFSTEYCARCPATRRMIEQWVREMSGMTYAHVDVTNRPVVLDRFKILRTPTVLVLDAQGMPRVRLSGVISTLELQDAIGVAV